MELTLTNSGQTYPPIGRCIYCGTTQGPLTEEHILPAALQGGHVLPEASCLSCAKVINEQFEQYCLKDVFGIVRKRLGLKSSVPKRRKRPRQKLRLRAIMNDGSIDRITFEAGGEPMLMHLPLFPLPTAISRKPELGHRDMGYWMWQHEDTEDLLRAHGAKAFIGPELDVAKFARFVAKVVHGQACAVADGTFNPLLPDIILGKAPPSVELIGAVPDVTAVASRDHQVGLGVHNAKDGKQLVVGFLRIFGRAGSPQYCAVVGELIKPWPLEGSYDPSIFAQPPDTKPDLFR